MRDDGKDFSLRQSRPRDQAVQFVTALLLDEPDGESVRKMPDDAANAGADRKRRSGRRLDFGRHRNARHRDVDDVAPMNGAIGECQGGLRGFWNEARILPGFADAEGILGLLLQPDELFREPGAHRSGHIEFEQETACRRVADRAFEVAEVPEIGGKAVADLADHGGLHHHPERRNARGAAGEGTGHTSSAARRFRPS